MAKRELNTLPGLIDHLVNDHHYPSDRVGPGITRRTLLGFHHHDHDEADNKGVSIGHDHNG